MSLPNIVSIVPCEHGLKIMSLPNIVSNVSSEHGLKCLFRTLSQMSLPNIVSNVSSEHCLNCPFQTRSQNYVSSEHCLKCLFRTLSQMSLLNIVSKVSSENSLKCLWPDCSQTSSMEILFRSNHILFKVHSSRREYGHLKALCTLMSTIGYIHNERFPTVLPHRGKPTIHPLSQSVLHIQQNDGGLCLKIR